MLLLLLLFLVTVHVTVTIIIIVTVTVVFVLVVDDPEGGGGGGPDPHSLSDFFFQYLSDILHRQDRQLLLNCSTCFFDGEPLYFATNHSKIFLAVPSYSNSPLLAILTDQH